MIIILFVALSCTSDKSNKISDLRKIGPQADGSFLVPSNQILRPAGKQIYFPGRPVDLALSNDEKILAVLNKSSLEIINIDSQKIIQTLHIGGGASFKGIAFSSDQKNIFVSQARDKILIAQQTEDNTWQWKNSILFEKPKIGGLPVPGGFEISENESKVYVPLNRSNTLAIIDMKDFSIINEIAVGVAPFQAINLNDKKLYVSNWGGRKPLPDEESFKSSGSEVLVDPESGIANNGSVSVIDLNLNINVKNIDVGLHPTSMVLNQEKTLLYIACANSDLISVIDTKNDIVVNQIDVKMDKDLPFGSAPNALTLSNDGNKLFVANGTDNAICVIDLANQNKILGFIPTGWYPGSVILDKLDNIFVANTKGIGSRDLKKDAKGYNSHNHLGSVSIINNPELTNLDEMTEIVKENNSYQNMVRHFNYEEVSEEEVAVPVLPDQKSHFKHVVYIIKENRTYDQVFGDLPQGDGDTSLVHFGWDVTPNHHKLAEEFVLMDNYYCSGILSADGHQWTDEAYVTDYIEKFFGDFPRSYPYDGDDPIAYSPTGFIWDNVLKHGLTFRNYGEFVDAIIEPKNATFTDIYKDYKSGTRNIKVRAEVNLPQIKEYTCSTFVGFPEKVPDVYRAEEFIKEFREFEKNDNFPNFIIMLLPNDHTSGTRPGLPTPRAAVADNDLALGQIVEVISHSKFWKETCILVTEDDPQAGLDHIDGHRTVGLVISPYTKRGEVVSTNYSQINMFRTIENILGIPPLNQFDLAAEPMTDCFTDQPDFTPYKALPNKIPLDELNPSLAEITGEQHYWAQKSIEQNLDDYDRIEEETFNKIIWHSVKGYDVPYPEIIEND
ncbi:MAG: bifunctional YncE family protein/alkaline phosphatase family protein [Ignavibacteriales bacterium]|nr:bifunctional YncE family protein/alkaline phosphatase family protein [Ignavibacteriales bacterium]